MTLSLSIVGIYAHKVTPNQDILKTGEIVFLREEHIFCLSDTKWSAQQSILPDTNHYHTSLMK